MIDKIKGAYKSWTIWLNGIGILLLEFADSLQTTLPLVHEYIPQQAYSVLGIVLAANILLRFKTSKSLADK
jgi:hypothetical protein